MYCGVHIKWDKGYLLVYLVLFNKNTGNYLHILFVINMTTLSCNKLFYTLCFSHIFLISSSWNHTFIMLEINHLLFEQSIFQSRPCADPIIGFKLVEFPDHWSMFIFSSSITFFPFLEVCRGARSCWKIQSLFGSSSP